MNKKIKSIIASVVIGVSFISSFNIKSAYAAKFEEIVEPKYDKFPRLDINDAFLGDFTNVSLVYENGKCGLMNKNGAMVLRAEFDKIYPMVNGTYLVQQGEKVGLVNYMGKEIVKTEYDSLLILNDEVIKLKKGDEVKYVDEDGKEISNLYYHSLKSFGNLKNTQLVNAPFSLSEGLNVINGVEQNSSNGEKNLICKYIDKDGNAKLEFKGCIGSPFSNGLALLIDEKNNSKTIDINGKVIFEGKYKVVVSPISDRFICMNEKGMYGIIDSKGNTIKNFEYDNFDIKDNFLSFSKEKKYGLLNLNGDVVIDFKYDEPVDFKDGVALVTLQKEKFYINTKDEIVSKLKEKHNILGGERGNYIFEDDKTNKKGILGKDGKVLLEPKYNNIALIGPSVVLENNKKIGYAMEKSDFKENINNKIRLGGGSRYETSCEISNSAFGGTADYAILVSGESYADALSATSLAKKYNAPILLTTGKTLNENTLSELKRLKVKNVFLVGGEKVISEEVETFLKDSNLMVKRIWGKNRYETSVKVCEALGGVNGVFLVNGDSFQDALSVAPIAANKNMGIILTSKGDIDESLTNYKNTHKIDKTYIIGGEDIINSNYDSQFKNVTRIYGNTKYERNLNIMNTFESDIDFSNLFVSNSSSFADALSGSIYAAKKNSFICLVNENLYCTPYIDAIRNKSVKNIYILGGEKAISNNFIEDLFW